MKKGMTEGFEFDTRGFEIEESSFEGTHVNIIFPKNKNGKLLLKTMYWGAFPDCELDLVEKGWTLAFIRSKTRWCLDEDLHQKARFVKYMAETYGLEEKCVPVGMSCGGLIAVKFAALYPELVHCLYLDAPVMNFLSCPAALTGSCNTMWEEFKKAMGMDLSDLISYREHPIDKIPTLIENRIPVICVYGDSDDVVFWHENGAILEKAYAKTDIPCKFIGKKGCNHHPHGLEDTSPIVEFIEKYS
ncbi:MAG: alpha/beta hydrolase [Ruminococcaceae bacterium]|nr:alpha/beta hydrolase [Oscillospiraceae bacterium]